MTLSASKSQVVYATIRGGSYANENLPTILETRASTNLEYARRVLLKFNTDTTLPQGTPIASAILTLTVQDASGDPSRMISAYPITSAWVETAATWNDRLAGQRWAKAGGDLGSVLSTQPVSNTPGSRVSFDVTPLVQQAVSGKLGTWRYTRIALVDRGVSTHDSWRSYYTPDATTAALRPTLTIQYGTTSTSSSTTSDATSGSTCAVKLSSASIYVGGPEANWSVNVTAPSTCAWSAATDEPWLLVRSTIPSAGAGNGTIKLRAETNTTSAAKRVGHVLVNGATYTITQSGCGSACGGAPTEPPPPPPNPPTPPTSSTLRVLHWNTHHGGLGTDGVWSPSRLANYIASFKPDVVSLNEMEYKDSNSRNTDEPATIASLLKQATGKTWYYKFVVGNGATTGIGNLLLSSIPFETVATHQLADGRAIVGASITVNGRTVSVFSTHLDDNSASTRLAEVEDLVKWGTGFLEQRIMCGDFNAGSTATEMTTMKQTYVDSWAEAQSGGTAIAYAGNTAGNTRNGRIDYIYYSKNATKLKLISSQVYDVRDANGVMPSDHRPILSTFQVQ